MGQFHFPNYIAGSHRSETPRSRKVAGVMLFPSKYLIYLIISDVCYLCDCAQRTKERVGKVEAICRLYWKREG